MAHTEKGNVLIYVLLAVGLMAALTYAISRDNGGQEVTKLDASKNSLLASELIAHATAAQIAVDQMTQWGVNYDEILFDKSTDAGYTTNSTKQIYHPSGGGLIAFSNKDSLFDNNGSLGWKYQGNINIEWSNSISTDLIYTFINVDPNVCSSINSQLFDDDTVPSSTVNFVNTFTESTTDSPFIAAECAACESKKSLCITDGTTNAFYTILGSR